MKKDLYPIKFNPIFKEKIWGGRNLETLLGKPLPQGRKIGESWEICDREGDQTTVQNGIYQGLSLHELMTQLKQSLLGNRFDAIPKRFPLLFKIIDAHDDLSLQVHPDDHYAAIHEKVDPGKTEMWYVLHTQDSSRIYCGLKKKTDLQIFKDALQSSQSVTDYLQIYSPHAGDVFFIPAGTVHALGKGNVVIEVQENSDITYRLSDWGRIGDDGKPRPLHIEKGIEVAQIDSKAGAPLFQKKGAKNQSLLECSYFRVSETIYGPPSIENIDPQACQVWTILEGKGTLESKPYDKGDFILIPAHIGKVSVQPASLTRILKTEL